MSTEAEAGHERGLRRELRFWEAIALSIGIMAPGAAMALNGTLPASLVGRAVPLAFVFASVGILFVSYAFIRLTGYFNHAGSVYALSGVTLGPRAGFFSGWALRALTYRSPPRPPQRWDSSGKPSSTVQGSGRTPSGS
jgi:amino acid transporter